MGIIAFIVFFLRIGSSCCCCCCCCCCRFRSTLENLGGKFFFTHSCLMMLDVFSWIPRWILWFKPLWVKQRTDHPPQIFGVNMKTNQTPPSQYLELFKATKWWKKTWFAHLQPHSSIIIFPSTPSYSQRITSQFVHKCNRVCNECAPETSQKNKIPICCSWSNHRENNWWWSTKLALNKCLI